MPLELFNENVGQNFCLSSVMVKSWSHHEQVLLLSDYSAYLRWNILTKWRDGFEDDMIISVVRIQITNAEVSYQIGPSELRVCNANLWSTNLGKHWWSVDLFTWNIKAITGENLLVEIKVILWSVNVNLC